MQLPASISVTEFGIPSQQVVPGFRGDEFGELARLIPVKRAHVFERKALTMMRLWWVKGGAEPLYIVGPTGCGKTTTVEQFCARVRAPMLEIVGREDLQKADLVGSYVLTGGGTMKFVYGPAALVWKHGGVLLVNEMTAAPPGFWVANKDLLGGRPLLIEATGEVIERHPWARVVFTDNTRGLVADDTGSYQGRFRQDAAVMDETWKLHVDYMPEQEEIELLKQGMPFGDDEAANEFKHRLATALRRFAEGVRNAYLGQSAEFGALEATMSTRTLLRMRDIMLALRGAEKQGLSPVHEALDIALGNALNPTSRLAVHKLADMVFGADTAASHQS